MERIVNKKETPERGDEKEMPAFMQLGQSSVNPPCGGRGRGGRWAGKPELEMQMLLQPQTRSILALRINFPGRANPFLVKG